MKLGFSKQGFIAKTWPSFSIIYHVKMESLSSGFCISLKKYSPSLRKMIFWSDPLTRDSSTKTAMGVVIKIFIGAVLKSYYYISRK